MNTTPITIRRYPNRAGMLRGPNMHKEFCQACYTEKTHGYKFMDEGQVTKQAFFICDDCLNNEKETKPIGGLGLISNL